MRRITVGIVDYQSGNIRSVMNAVEHAGGATVALRTTEDFSQCSHVVLPGVGAFGFCVDRLRASGLLPALETWALVERRPLLGVCVGMQILADVGEEHGEHRGLGWIGGRVRRLCSSTDAPVRIPHVGWNDVHFNMQFGEFRVGDTRDFYFDHSYAFDAEGHGEEVAACEHGRRFSAIVRRDNIVAVQFHPEKSQAAGMRLLASFFAA